MLTDVFYEELKSKVSDCKIIDDVLTHFARKMQ